ncbi:hypothetical protein MES4922_410035 [Mesorhizobium ventifaucium]|uniref:Secreted protein n=1 Tax=Mesorhizobium ventifaucium TaxID=666020 RepID=A0ABM9E9S6_9HYPH|nr:hypothetical protein MES4922_410035 [Mesorhizobium ventifaucium]
MISVRALAIGTLTFLINVTSLQKGVGHFRSEASKLRAELEHQSSCTTSRYRWPPLAPLRQVSDILVQLQT